MTDFWQWHRRATNAIAHGYLTNSKRPQSNVMGVVPTHINRGLGPHVWDHQGNKLADYICGLGVNMLGYGQATVTAAIVGQVHHGVSHSLATTLEVETAEKVKELFPFIERLRFLKTGSDACMAAIRIARAATGRREVMSEGYHGIADDFVSMTPPAHGIPTRGWMRPLDMAAIDDRIAAVIIEPVNLDYSRERIEWLKRLREKCTASGTVLIFDEVITGFRWPKFCVARWCGVIPDLICLGKAIANGMPLSVVGGSRAIMEPAAEYFISSTYAGDALSLAAAKASMQLHQTADFDTLWLKGAEFCRQFNALMPEIVTIEGYPTRGVFKGDIKAKALFWQEAIKAGLLMGPSWFYNYGLSELLHLHMPALAGIAERMKLGMVKLEGELPMSPFAAKVRGQ